MVKTTRGMGIGTRLEMAVRANETGFATSRPWNIAMTTWRKSSTGTVSTSSSGGPPSALALVTV